jgi:serine/threonine protein kinase, bacterial
MAELLNNRYQVIRALGSGGFGETFLAEDLNMPTRRRCVVKKLKLNEDDPETLALIKERFQREAAILEVLGHQNPQIPDLYAYFVEKDNFYLVQEWIEGETLSAKLRQQGPFSQLQVRQLLIDLLPVLTYVHGKNIIHRDIKPDNIILRKDDRPVLIDFGAVKEAVNTAIYQPGQPQGSIVIGTPGYLPPEQAVGRPIFASDIYSLGMTAINLLTGKSPQELDTNPRTGEAEWEKYLAPALSDIRQTMVSIDPRLAAILSKSIQTHPRDRYNSATEMLADLQSETFPKGLSGLPAGNAGAAVVSPPTVLSPPSPPPRPAAPAYPAASNQQASGLDETRAVLPDPGQAGQRYVSSPNPPYPAAQNPATQVISPSSTGTSGRSGSPDWLKPVLIGGAAGVCLLAGVLVLRAFQSGSLPETTPSPTVSVAESSPTETEQSGQSPSPTPTPIETPSPSPDASPVTNLPCGDPTSEGATWYPVFVNNGDLAEIRRKYCADAFASKREDGTPTVQVASFTSQERAAEFAQQVGGQVGKPRELNPDNAPNSPNPTSSAAAPPSEEVNATIVGESGSKNVRSGPGTSFSVTAAVEPGDRVQILGSTRDAGGFIWYRILIPSNGRQGWIAAQLIKLD